MFSSFRSCSLFRSRWQMTSALCAFALGLAQAQSVDPNPPLTAAQIEQAVYNGIKSAVGSLYDDEYWLQYGSQGWTDPTVTFSALRLFGTPPELGGTGYDAGVIMHGLYQNLAHAVFTNDLGEVVNGLDVLTNQVADVSYNTTFIGSPDFEWYISQLNQLASDIYDDVRYLSYWDHYNSNENGADVWVQNFDELVENLISELHYGTIDFANVIRDTMLGDDTNASTSEAYGQLEDYAEAVDTNLTTAAEIISDPHLDEIQGLVNPENFSSDLSSLLPDAEGLVSSGSLSYTITFTDGLLLFGFDIPQIKVDYSFLMDSDCNFTLFRDAIYFALFFVWLFRFVLHNITHLASLGQSQRVS